jgi:hypothetical protein
MTELVGRAAAVAADGSCDEPGWGEAGGAMHLVHGDWPARCTGEMMGSHVAAGATATGGGTGVGLPATFVLPVNVLATSFGVLLRRGSVGGKAKAREAAELERLFGPGAPAYLRLAFDVALAG